MDDSDITWAIERRLINSEAVDAHMIDVQTAEGVVTLSGSVSNLLARDRAVRIAKATKGVRAAVNKLKVDALLRPDKDLQLDVRSALANDPVADSYELQVQADAGTVTITGTVESWAEREIAENVAKDVRGVRAVEHEITVAAAGTRPDAEIADEVRRRLELNPHVEEENIEVKVNDATVVLTGRAGSLYEKSEAYHSALVMGVDSVDNDGIEVRWLNDETSDREQRVAIKPDSALEKAVEDALYYDPRTLSFEIDVEADAGVVTLRGIVDNLYAKQTAEKDAENTVGVSLVRNRIRVRPEEAETDEALLERVELALRRDAYLERHEIGPVVRNQKVYLYGTVDTYFEKERAERTTSLVDGVVAVSNMLSVGEERGWKSDELIAEEIRDEWFWNASVDERDVKVDVDNGTARLRGKVDTWHEFHAIVDNAFDAGAVQVEPHILLANDSVDYPTLGYEEYKERVGLTL